MFMNWYVKQLSGALVICTATEAVALHEMFAVFPRGPKA
jgi:hypothetical protein